MPLLHFPSNTLVIIMSFVCTGTTTFTALSTDYSNYDNDGEYIVTVTADSTWSENTKAKVTAEWMNMTFKKKDILLCDSDILVDSSDCGQAGTFKLDFGDELKAAGITSEMIAIFDNSDAYIKVEVKNGKSKETCTQNSPNSIQIASNPYVTGSSSASVISTLVGAFALVGLAGYAWKRHKISTSENDADQRLYSGDIA